MRAKNGVGSGRDRGLGGLGPAGVLAVEQRAEVESKITAVIWLAHGRSLIKAASRAFGGLFATWYHIVETATSDSALPGASWLLDLRNSKRTENADVGNPPTEFERLDAWQDPDGREQQQWSHLFPPTPDADVVPSLQLQNHKFPAHPVRFPVSFSPRVNVVRPLDSSGHFLPRSDSHQSTHDESTDSPRMRNERRSFSRNGQPNRADAPDHTVIHSGVEKPNKEFDVGTSDWRKSQFSTCCRSTLRWKSLC